MITTSTTETVPFTPSWHCGEDGTPRAGAPVFHLRQGGVIERGQLQAALSGPHRAGQIFGFELREAIRTGVTKLLADDPELGRVLELVEAEGTDEAETMTDADRRVLVEIRGVLEEHWPPYRDLRAQMDRRREIAPIVSLQRFCTGWDNVVDEAGKPVPYVRGRDGVAELALGRLQSLELLVAGNRAYQLQFGGGEEEAGNSARPGSSAQDPTTSPMDATSKADGTSADGAGAKTPA